MKKIILYLLISISVLLVFLTVLFGHRDKSVEDLIPEYGQPPSSFIEIDGMNVHYRDEGIMEDTVPIVLIHGTGASLHTFNAWTEELSQKKRVIRMDLPAFGLTGPFPDRDYTINHYSEFINDFLVALNIKYCIIGGNSLGGLIAWRYTITHPEMVDKLILIDAAGYPRNSTSVPLAFTVARIPVINKTLTFITPRSVIESSVKNVYTNKNKVTDELVDRYFNLSLREGNRQALVDRMKLDIEVDQIKEIKNIYQPTLIIWGEKDELITIESAYRFYDDLPNDTLVIIENAGHVPMEEQPEESLKSVKAFLGLRD
ncbi:alpha/beta fold hydrolase [Marinigracilibium pacificum]|uniref:alpha/beta fold hydrolase n=1 Tax=Marinigracilibium pacificum TaxID=2729599 RepID=UPI00232A3140|nr:alpha/beta hydrolase [Marinigracilibium pacificum]